MRVSRSTARERDCISSRGRYGALVRGRGASCLVLGRERTAPPKVAEDRAAAGAAPLSAATVREDWAAAGAAPWSEAAVREDWAAAGAAPWSACLSVRACAPCAHIDLFKSRCHMVTRTHCGILFGWGLRQSGSHRSLPSVLAVTGGWGLGCGCCQPSSTPSISTTLHRAIKRTR